MKRLEPSHLFLSNDADSFFVELLARYLHLDTRFKVNLVRITPHLVQSGILADSCLFVDQEGKWTSTKCIAKRLAELVSLDELLIGSEGQQANDVTLKHFDVWSSSSVDDMITFYNKELEKSTFLEREHVTCADLIVFCRLHAKVLEMTEMERYQHNHLLRWFNHIQNLPWLKDVISIMGKDFAIFPVKISKKQLKAAEKKNKKDNIANNPHYPRNKDAGTEGGDKKAAKPEGQAKQKQQQKGAQGKTDGAPDTPAQPAQ